jgi:hypothetical protein
MSGLPSGSFFESISKLSVEAKDNGDFGLWLACIYILAHIDPEAGKSQLQTGITGFQVSRLLEVSSTDPGSLYWQLMSMYTAAQAGRHHPLPQAALPPGQTG